MDHHVRGGKVFVDIGFDHVHHSLRVLEGSIALENQVQVGEHPPAALSHADTLGAQDSRNRTRGLLDPQCGPFRSRIHQRVHGPLAEPQADINDNPGNHQRS